MPQKLKLLFACFVLFLGACASSAAKTDALDADSHALTADEVIAHAVDAAGGEGWKRPQTLMFEGTMIAYTDGYKDKAVVVDDYRMWRKFPAVSENAHAANGKVRFDAKVDGEILFQIAFDGTYSYNQDGLIGEAVAQKQWAAAFGFGIIRFADGEGFSTRRLADDQVAGHPCYLIEVTDPAGEKTIFGIDRKGYEIRMVGFDTPRGWHHRIYDDFAWHEEPKFRQPRHVRLYYQGRLTNDIRWPVFRINTPISDNIFVLN